jgi:beta-galactosidase
MRHLLLYLLLPVSTLVSAAGFKVHGGAFVFDGKPYQIRSGEIHCPRVPKAEWASRIRMAKAMGLNTISTYVFWNIHESKPGEFDFTGDKDVAEFVRTCAAEDMKVIVRPGPYVCAEWDLGEPDRPNGAKGLISLRRCSGW